MTSYVRKFGQILNVFDKYFFLVVDSVMFMFVGFFLSSGT